MTTASTASAALRTYDALAPAYDLFTADYDYERWLEVLEGLAVRAGAPGRRLLDVACGTGRSFEPMLTRGYEITGCDISAPMARQAARRLGDRGRIGVCDMRTLPDYGQFDLITCLDDAVNYLLDVDDLDATFASARRRLAPGGVYLFDVNTLGTYRTAFASDDTLDRGGVRITWRGRATPGAAAHGIHRAQWELGSATGGSPWRIVPHVQRHWPVELVRERLALAGLDVVSVLGQSTGVVMSPEPDEHRHTKAVFVARCRE